jgi:hypothetical protein
MELVMQLGISIILGLLPEVLYFTLFLIYTKNIKEKRLRLGILIAVAYAICMFIQRYEIIYYVGFVSLVYLILKLLYKNKVQIIDIFVFSISTLYLTSLSYISFIFLNKDLSNYFILLFASRIFLFIPFLFKSKFNILYKKYCGLWNRNDNAKRPIKSITLRNISLVIINLLIFIINIFILKMATLM